MWQDHLDQGTLANAISVNEAKMQISNAPTNGYFLSAQSGNTGGLTWAQAGSSTGTLEKLLLVLYTIAASTRLC